MDILIFVTFVVAWIALIFIWVRWLSDGDSTYWIFVLEMGAYGAAVLAVAIKWSRGLLLLAVLPGAVVAPFLVRRGRLRRKRRLAWRDE